ncbi:MAG: isopropylmalate isomerase [Planctomycetaceae bacterium]|nr:MAG: isopropylmalate isomerase [Planctomycetaceae bacterium]
MPQAIVSVQGRAVPLLFDDIDTDRIIPARFLRCVTFDGLGAHAFEDDRQQDPTHPFNDARFAGAKILIVGRNFGCGSSREHAPQALMRWGIAAIVGESFAEIFFGNCTSLGIPCVRMKREDLEQLALTVQQRPATTIAVDLQTLSVRWNDCAVSVSMPDGPRQALLTGNWDFLGQLLEGTEEVHKCVSRLPYMNAFQSFSVAS